MPITADSAPNIHPDQLLEPKMVRQPESEGFAGGDSTRTLFQHRKRPAWGLAICISDLDGRKTFQFEDGKMRTFPEASQHLLEEVSKPADEMASLSHELQAASGINLARKELEQSGRVYLDFAQQVALFETDFPDGFAGAGWQKEVRGATASSRLKRHRDPAMAEAAEKLGDEALDELIDNNRDDEVVQRMIEVLANTNLVSRSHLTLLRKLSGEHSRNLALAIRRVTSEEVSIDRGLQGVIEAIQRGSGQAPSWPLTTALFALLDPVNKVCVRPTSFREQARTLAPNLKLAQTANGRQYGQLLRLAQVVSNRLAERGFPPQDLFDVYDFMWQTLRPSARDRIGDVSPVSQTRSRESQPPKSAPQSAPASDVAVAEPAATEA